MEIVNVGGELVTITIRRGVWSWGGGGVLPIFSMCISASECPFYVDFSLDDHLKNCHLLSTVFLAK